jgi:hypothetical protein
MMKETTVLLYKKLYVLLLLLRTVFAAGNFWKAKNTTRPSSWLL